MILINPRLLLQSAGSVGSPISPKQLELQNSTKLDNNISGQQLAPGIFGLSHHDHIHICHRKL